MSSNNTTPKEPIIYVQGNPKNKLQQLVNNPPLSVLTADSKSVLWLDALKKEIANLK